MHAQVFISRSSEQDCPYNPIGVVSAENVTANGSDCKRYESTI